MMIYDGNVPLQKENMKNQQNGQKMVFGGLQTHGQKMVSVCPDITAFSHYNLPESNGRKMVFGELQTHAQKMVFGVSARSSDFC